MKINVRRLESVVVVEFEGGLDKSDLPKIEKRIDEAFVVGGNRVVVDLGGVSFLSSAALGYFVRLQKRSRDAGGDVVLARPTPFMIAVLATLGLDHVFWIHSSVESAVARFTAPPASHVVDPSLGAASDAHRPPQARPPG